MSLSFSFKDSSCGSEDVHFHIVTGHLSVVCFLKKKNEDNLHIVTFTVCKLRNVHIAQFACISCTFLSTPRKFKGRLFLV